MNTVRLKKKTYIILFGSVIILLAIYAMRHELFYTISPKGEVVSEDRIIMDAISLTAKEGLITDLDNTHVFSNGSNQYASFQDDNGTIDKKEKVIHVFMGNRRFARIDNPIEVRYAMRLWLYLEDRSLPFSVAGINVFYKESGFVSSASKIIISKKEFDEIYKTVHGNELDETLLIEQMAKVWIEKHNYSRPWIDKSN